jgi:hypothetical protein
MILRSTDIRSALRSKQRGFLLNPHRFGSAPPAFAPSDIANLALWIDPSDSSFRSVTAGAIDSVTCKQTATVFSQGTTANKPLLNAAGGLMAADCMDFGLATNAWLNNATGVTLTIPYTLFFVVYWRARSASFSAVGIFRGTATNGFNTGTGAAPYHILYTSVNSSGVYQCYANTGGTVSMSTTASHLAKGSKGLYEAVIDTPIANSSIKRDGSALSKSTAGTTVTGGNFTTLGSCDSTYVINGAMGEIVGYNGILSAGDATSVRNYLKSKWGTP